MGELLPDFSSVFTNLVIFHNRQRENSGYSGYFLQLNVRSDTFTLAKSLFIHIYIVKFVKNISYNFHFFSKFVRFVIYLFDYSAKTSLDGSIFQMLIVFSMTTSVDVQN